MPMPTLDPSRFIAAVLADPTHKLPLPDRGGRLFLDEGETVDSWEPFYAHLLADGSLKPKPAMASVPEAAPSEPAPGTTDTPPVEPSTSEAASGSGEHTPPETAPVGAPATDPTTAH